MKRAHTSATRCAPLAITTNWIVMRIANTIKPTTMLPRTTNCPNAGISAPTPPGSWPSVRISRVALTSSASRNSVASSSDGAKAENSSGSSTRKLISSTSAEPKTLSASSASSSGGGRGTMRIATTPSTATANALVSRFFT